MLTWAFCRRIKSTSILVRPKSLAGSAGFTLLEMIVVLVIVGIVAAVVAPNLPNFVEAVTNRTDRDRVLDEIAGLGTHARLQGRALLVWPDEAEITPGNSGLPLTILASYDRHQLSLPPNWRLELDRPLLVRANGVCLGALLALQDASGRRYEYDLEGPYCRIQ